MGTRIRVVFLLRGFLSFQLFFQNIYSVQYGNDAVLRSVLYKVIVFLFIENFVTTVRVPFYFVVSLSFLLRYTQTIMQLLSIFSSNNVNEDAIHRVTVGRYKVLERLVKQN